MENPRGADYVGLNEIDLLDCILKRCIGKMHLTRLRGAQIDVDAYHFSA
jgi:hypothetical protein